MAKLIELIKRHPAITVLILIIFVALLVFGIPILINRAYQFPAITSWLAMSWDAADVLNYYGVIVGALVAGAGVAFSVLYSLKNYKYIQEQYRDDLRNRVLPYFAITMQREKYDHSYLTSFPGIEEIEKEIVEKKEEPNNTYRKYPLEQIYFVLESSGIQPRENLSEEDKKILEHAGSIWKREKSGYSLASRKIISMPLLFQNVGQGIAVETRIGFNKAADDHKYIAPVVVGKGKVFPVHIFGSTLRDFPCGEYHLDIVYKDILGNRYRQRYPITFTKSQDKGDVIQSLNFEGNQERIEIDDL